MTGPTQARTPRPASRAARSIITTLIVSASVPVIFTVSFALIRAGHTDLGILAGRAVASVALFAIGVVMFR